MAEVTLQSLYTDASYQRFAEEMFNFNGTFDIDYNLQIKIDYMKQTPFSFKQLGLVDFAIKVNDQFKTNQDGFVDGSRVLSLIESLGNLEKRRSNKLQQLISEFRIKEAIPVIDKIITEPRITVINRIKQNKFFTLTKLFSYSYLHYLLSPFIDNISFNTNYIVDYKIDFDALRKLKNNQYTDRLVWLQDIAYDTFSEITRYYKLIEKVIYKKEFATIISSLDLGVLYLNWLDRSEDKLESMEYLQRIISLRSKFSLGYVSYEKIMKHLGNLYIPVDIVAYNKPVRTIINPEFIKNLIESKQLTSNSLRKAFLTSITPEDYIKASKELESGTDVLQLIQNYELKYPDIYQRLFKNILQF